MKPHSVKTIFRCILSLLLLFLTVTFLNPSNAFSQDAGHYFQLGMELKDKGNINEAIEAFKNAALKDRRFAESYHQLALCYLMQSNSNMSVKLAMDAVVEARRLDWDNKEYIYTLADVYFAKDFLFDAKFWLNKMLEDDPDDIEALRRLALYNLKDYSLYVFNDADSILAEAVRKMDRVLAIDPNDREMVFAKTMLYFDDGDIETFIDYLKEIVSASDKDKDALMYLGLAFGEKGDHETAFRYYDRAFSQMSPEERAVFEDTRIVETLIDVDQYGNYDLLPAPTTPDYWDKKDPLFLTDMNERRLVHYGRVAEANLRFSVPRKGLAGWDTARGLIWIKYGRPKEIRKTVGTFRSSSFTWIYPDFRFGFLGGFYSSWQNKYVFALENTPTEIGGGIENKIADQPEKYVYKPLGELIDLPVDVVGFRGKDGKTEIEVFFGFPIDKIEWNSDKESFYSEIKQGVFVHDREWNRVIDLKSSVFPEFGISEIDTVSTKLLIGTNSFQIDPGIYSISVEATDPMSGNTGVTRDSITVEEYGHEFLQMSDILVSSYILLSNRQNPASRDNLTIIGEPGHTFLRTDPFFIYYEVYNLSITDIREENNYKIEYSFRPVDMDISRDLQKEQLLRNKPLNPLGKDEVWVSAEIRGAGPTDSSVLRIDHNLSESGAYEFIVKITDLLNGVTVSKFTPVFIF